MEFELNGKWWRVVRVGAPKDGEFMLFGDEVEIVRASGLCRIRCIVEPVKPEVEARREGDRVVLDMSESAAQDLVSWRDS